MFDIKFFMKIHEVQKQINNGLSFNKQKLFEYFEKCRNINPTVYNIETTNACNMRCKMCPRTTRMTRSIATLPIDFYQPIIEQLKPHSADSWKRWKNFCTTEYGIQENDSPSENHFFLYIIPKVIQLHGYGDPLLDKNLPSIVKKLTEHELDSYFSCNPANIDISKTIEIMDSGVSYIKYSFESTDDKVFKGIRGDCADFTEAFEKTQIILKEKIKQKFDTKIIITMIDVNGPNQQTEFNNLIKAFKDMNVYLYLKSEDQQWYRNDPTLVNYLKQENRDIPETGFHGTSAIHWKEICKHPWMSMSIKSDGQVHMCMEDYNNEIYLGNSKVQTLEEIWNGPLYASLRKSHFELTPNLKCTQECDMPKIGEFCK